MDIQSAYQKAVRFAGVKHSEKNQKIPGTEIPYVVHVCNVAMEILVASRSSPDMDERFAVTVALLHDTLEDTETTFDEIEKEFGKDVAVAVSALTKNKQLKKEDRMADSLKRIIALNNEASAVKLADRITNLQKPPDDWSDEKKAKYLSEARLILKLLKSSNQYLEDRLAQKIIEYENYILQS